MDQTCRNGDKSISKQGETSMISGKSRTLMMKTNLDIFEIEYKMMNIVRKLWTGNSTTEEKEDLLNFYGVSRLFFECCCWLGSIIVG